MNPRYPIYIISKGRADSRYTSRTLEYMNVPYFVVVEPQEYLEYAKVINSKKILVTPFKNLGQGSIPARNFVYEHAVASGVKKHWILDDNIKYFFRLNNHMKIPLNHGVCFNVIEDFVDRYTNVGLAGMQYEYFAPRKQPMNPFILNTRIYSCILINHAIKHKWRGKYNEDTDLSLRVLKDGWCTILINAFLCGKVPTMMMRGGNSTTIYNTGDNRKEFAESLRKQHPDVVEVIQRWNRWHHKVDYSSFKSNKLKFKKGVRIPNGVNEYGLHLIQFDEPQSIFNL
jgi:hypothetical protein